MTSAAGISGYIMSEVTQRNALGTTASDTALFVSGITAPLVDDLALRDEISPFNRSRLDALWKDPDFGARFPFLEIWLPDGTVAYSNVSSMVGKSFPLPKAASGALEGAVVSAFSDPNASEHVSRGITKPYLEIYTPLRGPGSGEVVAIAEIHEDSGPLEKRLLRLHYQTWATAAAMGMIIMAGLFGVVARAAREIESHQMRLAEKVAQLQQSLAINQKLRNRVRRASEKVSEINERFLRHLGADLHDGPIQLLAFATLNVERLRRSIETAEAGQLLDEHERVLKNAQQEIRQIAKGLLMPDILELDIFATIERAIAIYEARTGATVELNCSNRTPELSVAAKICAFRFVQEGLINAFKHSDGRATVRIDISQNDSLLLSVTNLLSDGTRVAKIEEGLGLAGMRERIESLGGTMSVGILNSELRLVMELESAGR